MTTREDQGHSPDTWLTPDLYRHLHELVDQAVDRPADERRSFLSAACGTDNRLFAEAVALLEARQALEEPAAGAPSSALRIGPYLIERELGRGGMGTVYLARRADDSYDKRVAIKLIRPDADNEEVLARFSLERQILASLDHPNIARLIDGGAMEGGRPYLVMDYVDGVPITTYADRARLSIPERLVLFRTVCAAVEHAHQNLVVHRDIKPTNILVTADGTPKLLDFGIAKVLTRGGRAVSDLTAPLLNPGTPRYASPEQAAGEPVNTAADVYALGVVLFELLTSRLPYSHDAAGGRVVRASLAVSPAARPGAADATGGRPLTATAIAAARGSTPEKLARQLRGDLDAIVQMALHESVHERYRSVAELSDDLQRHLDAVPVVARPKTVIYRASRFAVRHQTGIAGAALVLLTLSGGIVSTYYQWQRAEAERERAERRFDSVRSLAASVLDVATLSDDAEGRAVRQGLVQSSLRYLGQLEREAGADAAFLSEIAAGYRRVGDIQRESAGSTASDSGAALSSYREALRLSAQSVSASPSSADARRELATSFERVGTLLTETGESREGRESLRQSLLLYQELLEADRASASAQRDLMLAHLRYADAVAPAEGEVARSSYEQARRIAESLVVREPENADARRDLLLVTTRIRAWQMGGDAEAVRAEEARFFAAIRESDDPARLEYFLSQFPEGEHVGEVRARLAALRSGVRPPQAQQAARRPAPVAGMLSAAAPAALLPAASEDAGPIIAAVIDWKPIPAGRFQMGCDLRPDRQCNQDERPRHWVTISRPFEMMATEVSLEQYRAYAQTTERSLPVQPAWNNDARHPVVNITWEQAQQFCGDIGGRLPTEAEWEWAALGGREGSVYAWGDSYARTMANAGFPGRDGWDYTSPVGTFPPNGYGLHDMAGNVWEWVADWYEPRYYERSPEIDPRGPSGAISRVLRGGSYDRPPAFLRVTQRGIDSMDRRREATGFRCVR